MGVQDDAEWQDSQRAGNGPCGLPVRCSLACPAASIGNKRNRASAICGIACNPSVFLYM